MKNCDGLPAVSPFVLMLRQNPRGVAADQEHIAKLLKCSRRCMTAADFEITIIGDHRPPAQGGCMPNIGRSPALMPKTEPMPVGRDKKMIKTDAGKNKYGTYRCRCTCGDEYAHAELLLLQDVHYCSPIKIRAPIIPKTRRDEIRLMESSYQNPIDAFHE